MVPRRLQFNLDEFRWDEIAPQVYKARGDEARGMDWSGITRHTLARAAELPAGFEMRYFELEPGGYSSLEKHAHAHFVVAIRGSGRALIGDQLLDCVPFDSLHVPPMTPHRWLNPDGPDRFGFLCTVDADRDRPAPLDDAEWEALRANPDTAPYTF
jgi:quercetin dioxygenase-like cupin family protein